MNFTALHNSPKELEQVQRLEAVIQKYQVPEFTSEVMVESGAIPHSHPVLTLNTREKDELGILQTLVHEQFHWYATNHPKYAMCIDFLKTKYSDDGEHNKSGKHPNSYWEHIIVCFNTLNYLRQILGAEQVEYIYAQWQPYPTLEKLIAENFMKVEADLSQFDMIYLAH